MNEIKEEKETIEVNTSDVVDKVTFKTKVKKHLFAHKIERFISDFELIIIIALYILLSLLAKGPFGPYHLSGWAFWWILFLALPLGALIFNVIKYKRFHAFPIGILVLVSYLLIGLLTGMWHPFWALFFIIPIYHTIVTKIIQRKIKKQYE